MRPFRRAAVLCVLALTVSACGGSGRAPVGAPSSSGVASPSASGPSSGRPGGAPSGGATRSTRRPLPAATARGGIKVPRAGTYTYDAAEDGQDEVGSTRTNFEQTAEIDPPVQRPDGVSVEIRTTRPSSDVVAGEVYLFKASGIDVLFADACALDRPATHLRLPLKVGATWTSVRTCGGKGDDGRTKVLSSESLDIGGIEVDTFRVQRISETDGAKTTKIQWFAPVYQMVVRSTIERNIDGNEHRIEQTLLSLTPA